MGSKSTLEKPKGSKKTTRSQEKPTMDTRAVVGSKASRETSLSSDLEPSDERSSDEEIAPWLAGNDWDLL